MSNPEIFFQTLAILDHPADPMVVHFQLCVTERFRAQGFGLEPLKAATGRLFARHARLRSALRCEASAFTTVTGGAEQAAALNERAWSANELSLEAFRGLALPFDEAPLLRFRFDPAQGLSVACHHSLMDGYGCFELSSLLLAELYPLPDALPAPVFGALPLWMRFFRALTEYRVMILDHLRQMKEISRNPTSLVGPVKPPLSQRQFFLTRKVPLAHLQRSRASLRQQGRDVTLNDLILTAFHLALHRLISKKGEVGRLSITVPFNMRPRRHGDPLFANRTGYVSISTLPEHRQSREQALERVHGEMARAKKYGTGGVVELILSLYERLGLLKFARKAWLKNRMPARYEGPETFFWKNFDTAVVTNLGRMQAPEPYMSWVSEAYGFAPVISPSVGLAVVGLHDQVCLGLRFGSSVLSESEGAALLDDFIRELSAFG